MGLMVPLVSSRFCPWSHMLQLWLYRVLLRCHQFSMGHLDVPLGDATLHGSTALPPIQFFSFFFFSVFQGNNDGSDGLLGLIMALFLIAHASTALLRKKKHVLIWFINVEWLRNENSFFFHSLLENFQLRFSRSFKSMMMGPMVPSDSSWFSLWLPMLRWPITRHHGLQRAKRVLHYVAPLKFATKEKWESALLAPG